MSHPYNEHRANKVSRDRVSQITSGYTKGDTVKAAHPSGVERARGGAVKAPARADGGPVKARADKVARAKGGRVKGSTTVNVIVAPKGQDGPPPMAAMPPPMPPKPPMMPPPAAPGPVAGLGGMPPGGPPPMPHAMGGRAYKKGGAVKSMKKSKSLKMSGEKHRASGGAVDGAGVKGKTGIGDRTQIQHSGNKSDSPNIGRGAPITRATGGPIYADGRKGKQMSWNKVESGNGGGGGLERIAAAKRRKSAGHEPWTNDPGI